LAVYFNKNNYYLVAKTDKDKQLIETKNERKRVETKK